MLVDRQSSYLIDCVHVAYNYMIKFAMFMVMLEFFIFFFFDQYIFYLSDDTVLYKIIKHGSKYILIQIHFLFHVNVMSNFVIDV